MFLSPLFRFSFSAWNSTTCRNLQRDARHNKCFCLSNVGVLNHGCRCKVQSWRMGLRGGGNWVILLDWVSQLCEFGLSLGWLCFLEHFPESMQFFWPVPRIGMCINHSISQIDPNWGSGHFDVGNPDIPPPVLETVVILHKDTVFLNVFMKVWTGAKMFYPILSRKVALSYMTSLRA